MCRFLHDSDWQQDHASDLDRIISPDDALSKVNELTLEKVTPNEQAVVVAARTQLPRGAETQPGMLL